MSLAGRRKFAVATDLVVLRVVDEKVELLLVKRKASPFRGRWALPGGFLEAGEDLPQCAFRELFEETGLRPTYLEQLRAFAAGGRDPRGDVLSVAFLAFVTHENSVARAGGDADIIRWGPVASLPGLAFDHQQIVATAFEELAQSLFSSDRMFRLLPEEFTISEARSVFETFRGEPLDRRNFHKWFTTVAPAVSVDRTRRGAHRPARLFRVKSKGD